MPAASPLVVLDIGETLVNGPSRGPARRIAGACGLDEEQRRALHRALMTTDFEGPAAVAGWLEQRFGLRGTEPAIREVWRAQEGEPAPVAGALDALEALRRDGVRLALLSNIWAPYMAGVRAHYGPFFARHIPPELQALSYRTGVAKPDPRTFRSLLARAGVPAGRSVMVGDSYELDIEPAARLGMRTIRVLPRPAEEGEALMRTRDDETLEPTLVLRSIAELDAGALDRVMGVRR